MWHSRGVTRGDVVVLLLVIGGTFLLVLMGLSRARENARLTGCTNNLSRIGFALALYDQMNGHLPVVADPIPPTAPEVNAPPGPLKMLLDSLDIPDLTELRDGKAFPKRYPGQVPGGGPVPGFFCRSDPNSLAGRLPAPVSYRATTGGTPRGDNGAFAPGRSWRLAAIEARDGLSYTSAFSERLVGSGSEQGNGPFTYMIGPARSPDWPCPVIIDPGIFRNDAGSSWVGSDYRSTLYNHSIPPNGQPSCIAGDGRSAVMGASSGHVRGVNLLRLDGSVSLTVPTIAPKVWRDLAAIGGTPEDHAP
jgi:hypothetical protein